MGKKVLGFISISVIMSGACFGGGDFFAYYTKIDSGEGLIPGKDLKSFPTRANSLMSSSRWAGAN